MGTNMLGLEARVALYGYADLVIGQIYPMTKCLVLDLSHDEYDMSSADDQIYPDSIEI